MNKAAPLSSKIPPFLPLLLLGVMGAACQGTIMDPGYVAPDPVELPPELPPGLCEPAPPERVLPRLSRDQFRHSVEALFPVTGAEYELYPAGDDIAAVSEQEASALIELALAIGENAAADPVALLACAQPDDHAACVEEYLTRQLPRLHRRDVDVETRARYLQLQQDLEAEVGFASSLGSLVAALLLSPEFVYLEEQPATDGFARGYDLATRLSFFLWHQTPDDALLAAAASGALDTPAGFRQEAERLLLDPRAARGYRAFVDSWFETDHLELPVDVVAERPEALIASLQESLVRSFMDAAQNGSFADLMTSPDLWVDAELAAHLGMASVTEWQRVTDERSGLITHPALLTANGAAHEDGRVIHRGVFVYSALLCVEFGNPPGDATTSTDTRTESPACRGCHTRIDPVGFAFEAFDSGGVPITDRPLAVAGEVQGTDIEGAFDSLQEFSASLATSRAAQRCFTRALTGHALGRALEESEACVADGFADQLGTNSLRDVMLALITSDLFRQQRLEGEDR